MSCFHWSVPQDVRPGTARVLVTELTASGQINPNPVTKPCEHSDEDVEHFLSPEKLESLCGTEDLSHVTLLEICVDTQENTLGNFGVYLPRLVQLRMNNSSIMSVRDLGTTLSYLQVLWMSRCSLQDLDGISSFSSLKELYVAYNSVSDLSQVGMLENLQLLDLEGNEVDDLVQVQYLGLCGKLQTLTLEGNPVCVRPNPTAIQTSDYSYRAAVRELVPQLLYLDDTRLEEDGGSCSSTMGEEWDILQKSIKGCNSPHGALEEEETADSACPHSRPASARCPASSRSCVWPLPSAGCRPHTGFRPMSAASSGVLSPLGSRPGSADTDLATIEAETSILTHGAGKILFCGNPVQAIRARRDRLKTAPARSAFTPFDLPTHVPEHTYDLEEPDVRTRVDVFAELRAWREQHSRRLKAIETERLPQVLTIQHSEEDVEDDDEEEEGFGFLRDDSCDEEHEDEEQSNSSDGASPDSCFQSLSPDLHHRDALSPDVVRLSMSPDTASCPSPPLSAKAPTCNPKPLGVRARRLLSQINAERSPAFSRVGHTTGTEESKGDTDCTLQRVQQLTRTHKPLLPLPVPHGCHVPHPPTTSALGEGLTGSCAETDLSGVHSGNTPHQTKMIKLPRRLAITRPHSARAALQKHLLHH